MTMKSSTEKIDLPEKIEPSVSFRDALVNLVNRHSLENGSDTPDWILAEYLIACLKTFDTCVEERELWYGRKKGPCSTTLGLGKLGG